MIMKDSLTAIINGFFFTFSEKPASGIDTKCARANGLFADPDQCDLYYVCVDGVATQELCPDGLLFQVNKLIRFITTAKQRV